MFEIKFYSQSGKNKRNFMGFTSFHCHATRFSCFKCSAVEIPKNCHDLCMKCIQNLCLSFNNRINQYFHDFYSETSVKFKHRKVHFEWNFFLLQFTFHQSFNEKYLKITFK